MILQRNPVGAKSSAAVPDTEWGAIFEIMELPKPLRVGGMTGGPPLSTHFKIKLGVLLPPISHIQQMLTDPSALDRAPCLTALVASSCNAKPMA